MTTAVKEIEIDTETGLPVLPEGYFWRVGEKDINPGWYDKIPSMVPAVFIMEEAKMETKTREITVYGTKWWNKEAVVDTIEEPYEEMGEPTVVHSQTFSNLTVYNKEDIPDFCIESGASARNGVEYEWDYRVPLGKQGVAYIAEILYSRFQDSIAYRERQEKYRKALAETKEELYGDYPPKTIGTEIKSVEVPEVHDLFAEAEKLLEKFEEYAKPYPDAPPYAKGQTAAWSNAARMLREVLRK